MVARAHIRQYARQADPTADPSGSGLTQSTVTVTSNGAPSTGLAIDTSAGNNAPIPTPKTTTSDSLPTTTSDDPLPTNTADPTPSTIVGASSTKPIAMSTVIGTCVGAFIGASALVLFGLWMYKRYSQSLKRRANTRGPLNARNHNGSQRRSRLEAWNKLEDGGEDKWEGNYQTKETKEDQVAPMEKLTMFKKTPSVRTAYTHKSTDNAALHYPPSFAQFDPNLASTLTLGEAVPPMPEPRPFLGRVETSAAMSWDDESKSSYLSMASREGGAMSPSLQMAIPTPPPTFSQPHKWESAEVVHYSEGQAAEVFDPFTDEEENRKSVSNPFFGARDHEVSRHGRTRSRSDSTRTRSRSRSNSRTRPSNATPTKSAVAKGKERMRYSDPFDDMNEPLPVPPAFINHTASSSTSSMEKDQKERALQSLIAALEVPEEEVRDRLRIASMQPSVISQSSTIGPDEDVSREFPLPPTGRRS